MGKQPLKSTDKRRKFSRAVSSPVSGEDTDGAGPRITSLFTDRRKPSGKGKRLF